MKANDYKELNKKILDNQYSVRINIKPLSVNRAWQGKKFKTPAYTAYQRNVLLMLPNDLIIPESPLSVTLLLGFSSTLSDLDNPVKMILDILQKKYNFDDKDIFHLSISKSIVPKGCEFFQFSISNV